MIRTLILAVALAACAPTQARCDLDVTHPLAFTAPDAEDSISAHAIGPACDKTIGLLVLRTNEGYPIWSWSAPLTHRFGDVFSPEDHEHMQNFLERWAAPALATTQNAPAWSALQAGQTTLDELTYEDLRARNLPMLCHFIGTARETCIFWEPAAGGAGHFYDRDAAVPESE
jgi:hypothetical protein